MAKPSNESQAHDRIIKLVVDMGNTVLTKRAAADLFAYVNMKSVVDKINLG